MNYLDKVNPKILEYFKVLEPEFPEWLLEYINTEVLLKQQYISVSCGTIYSKLFDYDYFYSSLDHSIAVALICWHFTQDKKTTLSGLFHDIATPVFKHCVDFLNGDYMVQETTEDLTTNLIMGSKQIMDLLKRDKIDISEVDNYHIYPIADNDIPKLSSDRLEYSFINGMVNYHLINLEDVSRFYNDLSIQKNQDGVQEIGFKTKRIARDFVKLTSKLSIIYRQDKNKYSMQLLADILKGLSEDGLVKKADLYEMKENEVIEIIKSSKYSRIYHIWENAKRVKKSKRKPKGVYFVKQKIKIRYIDPLLNGKRISKVCKIAHKMIQRNLNAKMDNYIYLNFTFDDNDKTKSVV